MAKGSTIPKFSIGQIADPDDVNSAIKNAGTEEGLLPFANGGTEDATGVEPVGSQSYPFGDACFNKDKSLKIIKVSDSSVKWQVKWDDLLSNHRKFYKIAYGAITAGNVVALLTTDYSKVKAINASGAPTTDNAMIYGIANTSVSDGQTVEVCFDFYDLGSTSFSAGDVLYLSNDGTWARLKTGLVNDAGSGSNGSSNVGYPYAIGYVYYAGGGHTYVALNCLKNIKMVSVGLTGIGFDAGAATNYSISFPIKGQSKILSWCVGMQSGDSGAGYEGWAVSITDGFTLQNETYYTGNVEQNGTRQCYRIHDVNMYCQYDNVLTIAVGNHYNSTLYWLNVVVLDIDRLALIQGNGVA